MDTINEKKIRLRIKGHNGLSHGFKRGFQDVEFINVSMGNDPDTGGQGLTMNNWERLFSGPRAHLF